MRIVCILYTNPMPRVNYRIISSASNQLRFRGVITNQSIDTLINVYTNHDCIYIGGFSKLIMCNYDVKSKYRRLYIIISYYPQNICQHYTWWVLCVFLRQYLYRYNNILLLNPGPL